jgi:DNA-binding response OmpR family regulator
MWKRETHVLLIDDNVQLLDAITKSLERSGYAVSKAHDGIAGLERYQQVSPDLIVLDVMMPGMDGWEVCRRLRETSRVPIIMLTARANETDKIMGLRMGADDYVAKPFSLKELEARIEAVLRRVHMKPPAGDDLLYDDSHLRLETAGLQVLIAGEALQLTATERRLLFALAESPGRVLSVDQILRQVWGAEYEGQTDYVKLYVWRLRQKLEQDPSKPTYIRTERGLGYRFVPQESRENGAGAESAD